MCRDARMSWAQGETETDQCPVDPGPDERTRPGRRALVFRAKRDRVAMKVQELKAFLGLSKRYRHLNIFGWR